MRCKLSYAICDCKTLFAQLRSIVKTHVRTGQLTDNLHTTKQLCPKLIPYVLRNSPETLSPRPVFPRLAESSHRVIGPRFACLRPARASLSLGELSLYYTVGGGSPGPRSEPMSRQRDQCAPRVYTKRGGFVPPCMIPTVDGSPPFSIYRCVGKFWHAICS